MNKQSLNKVLVSLISVFIGLLVGSIVMVLTGYNPLLSFTSIFFATFGSLYNMGEWIQYSIPLILTGLSVGFAYRANLFNIGAEGQFIVGSFSAVFVGIMIDIPSPFHAIVAITAGIIAGAVWGMIPGLLKAFYGVSEVVVTIMLNYIALKYVNYLISEYLYSENLATRTEKIAETASINNEVLSALFDGSRINNAVFLCIFAVIIYWYLLNKTSYGYEVKAVGYSPDAAKYAGVNTKSKIVSTMAISGAFAGLAGAIHVLSDPGYMTANSSFLGYGFDGIAVALLGQLSAIGIVFAGLLIGALRSGVAYMPGVPTQIIDIMVGVIILASILTPHFLAKISRRFR